MTAEDIRTHDVVVIGAGPVGENVADRATAAGLSTVIVESELVGGECSSWACEPSKALLRPARGHGRLDGPRRVAVTTPGGGTVHLRARQAVAVCTGSAAALPGLPGLAGLRPWTSREATSAARPPGRLVVVGAGVVAAEMATAWQALGSEVVLLARGSRLLPRLEPFAGELVAERLREAGADLRFGVTVSSAARTGGEVRLALSDGERLSAAGDVNRRALPTHQGKYQARIAGAVIAARACGAPLDSATSPALSSTIRATGAGPARSSTPAAAPSPASPSPARAWPSSCTPPPSRSPARSPSSGSGTPCRPSHHQRGVAAAAGDIPGSACPPVADPAPLTSILSS
ncbi:FAD-dependent oxidoreductase [Nonomuraea rubra]|uniref:Dihydrolipoamide dehydrogenase n=1 Tax=Nonomuraea rubra TaxID=46180 RepID=A0A7X0NY82_9ACTN|nr:dihydrolipoamide dehydrogenase [Nonomuraea rubra]